LAQWQAIAGTDFARFPGADGARPSSCLGEKDDNKADQPADARH